ncbi:MAG: hypothetical protein ABI402_14575 [Ferruginibacter sp.]
MPWQKTSLLPIDETSNGLHDNGIFIFLCFLICGLLAIIGNPGKKLERANLVIISICGIISLSILGFMYSNSTDTFFASLIYGFYFTALSAIAMLAFMFLYQFTR